jgi:hypothetical protein
MTGFDTSVTRCLCGESRTGSWSRCAIRESWAPFMDRAYLVAGVPPATDLPRVRESEKWVDDLYAVVVLAMA